MSDWIDAKERVPEIGQRVWIAKCWKPTWTPRQAIWQKDGGLPAFFPGDGCAYLPGDDGKYRVSHWAAEKPLAARPGELELSREVGDTTRKAGAKRSYYERNKERIRAYQRDYYRRRREAASGSGMTLMDKE
jgi:hypothetical protein